VAGPAGAASTLLRPVELLLQYFRLQDTRHPDQTAQVLAALRVAVAQHVRGAELLQIISSAAAATSAGTNTITAMSPGEVDATVYHAPLKLRVSRDRSSRAPFAALPYDALEMHESDIDKEADYWQSTGEAR